ncbi:hypothetical protein B566_EDAN007900 [Ephemera danica]|nr:hypothetical protein B566_EDAN007900 [Ephemera danica]
MAPLRIVFAVVLLVLGASATQTVSSDGVRLTMDADDNSAMSANMKFMFNIYSQCAAREGGVMPCLKMRAINFFDRVSKLDNIPLADSVTLVRLPVAGEDRTSRALSESELEATLPQDAEQRDSTLSNLLLDRVSRFFSTHTVQVSLPQVSEGELARSLEEGRGKMKKMMGKMMMMFGAMKVGLLMLLKIKGLFFLAKKALIIAKIALVIALSGVLRKLMSGGGGGHESSGWSSSGGSGGWSSGGSSGGWNRRSVENAQELAYKAHRP